MEIANHNFVYLSYNNCVTSVEVT